MMMMNITRVFTRCCWSLNLDDLGCEVSAIRRRGIRALEPAPETRLEEGDVVVVLGLPEGVSAAEERLLQK